MNGEVQILQTEPVLFSLAIETEIALENKSIDEKNANVSAAEIEAQIAEISKQNTRFARLKKHMRKRSVSIL
jgi:hypothetical protein